MKPKFFFDYIYYRMTKAYFKWDGRMGATAMIGISMIQTLVIGDIIMVVVRLFFDREVTAPYAKNLAYLDCIIGVVFMIHNYRKYNGTYNKFKTYWKNESEKVRKWKGVLVVLSLILPWVPLILIGIFW